MRQVNNSSVSYHCRPAADWRKGGTRLHLSTGCNMQCVHCATVRALRGENALNRTGITIMTADGALDLVRLKMERAGSSAAVEIGGPGEPLLNADTYVLVRQLRTTYPDLSISVRTNGILLSDRLEELVRSGVSGIVLSISAVSQDAADALYDWVIYRGRRYTGRDASHLILQQQWNGLSNAVNAGVAVTVCCVRIPGVNDHEIDRIKSKARAAGADRVELMDPDL